MNGIEGRRRRSSILIAYESKQIRSLMFEGRSNRDIMELLNIKQEAFTGFLKRSRMKTISI